MRYIIETGCDSATLCAFDPAALPQDADERLLDDAQGHMETWQAEDRFCVGPTGGDGSYVFHVYVNAPLPEPEPGTTRTLEAGFERFRCPSGTLWFCGAEYAARDPVAGSKATPRGGLGRYPAQGGSVSLPPGEHALSVYRVQRPEEIDDSTIDLQVAASMLLWLAGGLAIAVAVFVLVVTVPGKLFQWAIGSALFNEGWHVYPITLGLFVAGVAAIAAGRWFDSRHRRSARAVAAVARRREQADYVVSVTLGARG